MNCKVLCVFCNRPLQGDLQAASHIWGFGKGHAREEGEATLGQKGVCSTAGTNLGMIFLLFSLGVFLLIR